MKFNFQWVRNCYLEPSSLGCFWSQCVMWHVPSSHKVRCVKWCTCMLTSSDFFFSPDSVFLHIYRYSRKKVHWIIIANVIRNYRMRQHIVRSHPIWYEISMINFFHDFSWVLIPSPRAGFFWFQTSAWEDEIEGSHFLESNTWFFFSSPNSLKQYI